MPKNIAITLLSVVFLGYVLLAQDPTQPAPIAPPPSLGKVLSAMIEDPALRNTAVGFCLLDDQGKVVATKNARLALIPASSLKTLITATALEILGPEFQFTTELRSNAQLNDDGLLDGDLIIKGGGDPTLSLDELEHLAMELQLLGLKSITGNVIGDASLFPETIGGDYWDWSDVGNGYGSPCAGLNLNHNRYTAHLQAGQKEGDPAKFIIAKPALPEVTFTNRVTTGPANSGDRVRLYAGPFATEIRLHGTIPFGSNDFPIDGAAPNPALFTAHHLDRLLRAAEEAKVTIGSPPTATYHQAADAEHPLITHSSPPLRGILPHLHAVSDNHEAECLYRYLGIHTKQNPATAIRAHWKKRGLELPSLRLVDGSGLGRANTISAHDLARLQHFAKAGPHGKLFHDSLIVAMEGSLHYKPGAMSGIRSYTGFIKGRSGKEYSFALLYNHALNSAAITKWTNQLLQSVQ